MKTRKILVVLALLAAGVGALLFYPRRPAPALTLGELGFAWRDGMRYQYALSYDGTQTVSLQVGEESDPARLEALTRLDVDLALSPRGRRGHVTVLGWRITAVRQAEIHLAGQALLPPAELAAALTAHDARLEIDRLGRIHAVQLPREAPELVQNTLRLLVAELQVQL